MRNRVFWNSPQTRLFSCLTLVGLTSLAFAGCGGGGGNSGGNNNGGGSGTTVISLTGTVKDTTTNAAPVAGATVTIVGTSLTATTDSSGHYSFVNVPATATAFQISRPVATASNYYGYADYTPSGGATGLYDIALCTFPLPTLHTGTNTIPEVDLLIASLSSPPPPPTSGCP